MEQVYSLYQKYRPQTFEQVVGQDKTINALKAAIEKGNPAHAYLFVGSRGIGKTTLARILASELKISPKDVYELDAASNSGVENVREIIEGAYLLPFESKYKVYILDEVHMFSKAAFNALLKTLEEPPAHAIFILATTEFDKVPETITSRCQVFFLQTPNQNIIKDFVIDVAKKEGFTLEEDAAKMIAIASNHSFRDALVGLQKLISLAPDKKITQALASEALDVPPVESVYQLANAIIKKDTNLALEAIKNIDDANSDWVLALNILINVLRSLYIANLAPKHAQQTLSEAEQELLPLLKESSSLDLSQVILELMRLFEIMKFTPLKKVTLEMGVVSVINSK